MKRLLVAAALCCAILAGCGLDPVSETDTTAVQTTAKPELTAVEIGEAFAFYSAKELEASGQTDLTWSNPAATGKAVLDYCHVLGVTTVAAADEAFLDAWTDLTVAGYLRGKTQAEAQTALSNKAGMKMLNRTSLDKETAKAKAYCPE